jgi:isoleucyl-tRNA synthetase
MQLEDLDLKKTVNLPRAEFGMKANLPRTEPGLLEKWEASNLYQRIRAARAGRPLYLLHDGPPYANGNIHLGTAFNKILKDFMVKSKSMAGFDAPYVPGWDCHGLPIEIKVDSELGSKKAHMSAAEIRAECRAYARKYVDIHRREFKRLGVFGRWEDPYLTMSPEYEAVIAQAFVDFLAQGYVYKGLKPVHWCIHCRTALAEAEVEYENHTSPSIWVRFALLDPAAIHPALARKCGVSSDHHAVTIRLTWPSPIIRLRLLGHRDRRRRLHCCQRTRRRDGGKLRLSVRRSPASRREPGRAVFRHPFLDRDSIAVHADYVTDQALAPSTARPRRGRLHHRQKYGLPRIALSMRRPLSGQARPASSPSRSSARPSGRQPIVTEILRQSCAPWPAAGALYPLLALPQAHHLPRHRAVVHRHGAQRSAAEGARGHPPGALASGLGRGADLQHGRHPARLVHLAPARLGCADHRLLLRQVPRHPN